MIRGNAAFTQLWQFQKYMPKNNSWGPARGQKRRAGAAFLPQAPLKYFIGHIFLQLPQ